jgi:hypothetical protein
MEAAPPHIREANQFVGDHHRHSLPTAGGQFASGAAVDGRLVEIAVAGRPVARKLDDGKTPEIPRVCTEGTPNANSFLHGRVRRIALLMGCQRVISHTLEEESGASLKAAGPGSSAKSSRRSGPCRLAPARASRFTARVRIHGPTVTSVQI